MVRFRHHFRSIQRLILQVVVHYLVHLTNPIEVRVGCFAHIVGILYCCNITLTCWFFLLWLIHLPSFHHAFPPIIDHSSIWIGRIDHLNIAINIAFILAFVSRWFFIWWVQVHKVFLWMVNLKLYVPIHHWALQEDLHIPNRLQQLNYIQLLVQPFLGFIEQVVEFLPPWPD